MNFRQILRRSIEFFLPINLRRFFFFFHGFFFKYHKSYSQKGEDLIILSYFKGLKIEKGVYLDIGCFHPVWISNTHLLHKNNWTGYAVDIDKYKLNSMKFARGKKIKCFLGAVTPVAKKNEISKVYKFNRTWSDLDTLDKNFADKINKELNINYREEEIELIDINDLFSKLPHINFLNIDVEGIDEQLIMSLNLKIYNPDVIVLEDNTWGGSSEIRQKMYEFNYRLFFISGNSLGFAKETKKNNFLNEFNL